MKWLYPIGLLMIAGSVHAETVNLVCTHVIDGKPYSSTLTITAPKPGVKGKVFANDNDLDSMSDKSSQVVKNVLFGSSFISYDLSYEMYRIAPNGQKEVSGSVDIEVKISRVNGKNVSTRYTRGEALSLFGSRPVEVNEAQCEPRRANKF